MDDFPIPFEAPPDMAPTQTVPQAPSQTVQPSPPPQAPMTDAELRKQARETRRQEMRSQLDAYDRQAQRRQRQQAAPPPPPPASGVRRKAQQTKYLLENQPTPGGIGGLVTGLILLMLLVFPVTTADGTKTTRAGLLWGVLTGKARVAGEQSAIVGEIASNVWTSGDTAAVEQATANALAYPFQRKILPTPTPSPVPTKTLSNASSRTSSALAAGRWAM